MQHIQRSLHIADYVLQPIFKYYHRICNKMFSVSSQATEQHTRRDPSGTQSPGWSLKLSYFLIVFVY